MSKQVTVIVLLASVLSYLLGAISYRNNLPPLSWVRSTKKRANPRGLAQYSSEDPKVLQELEKGGWIIFFRHAHRRVQKGRTTENARAFDYQEVSREISIDVQVDGNPLSEDGLSECKLLKSVFEELQLPISEVISSPVKRCEDTGELVFGRVDRTENSLVYKGVLPRDQRDRQKELCSQLFKEEIEEGKNRIIIAHQGTLKDNLGLRVGPRQSEAVILRPKGDSFEVLAQISLLDWLKMTQRRAWLTKDNG